jgi:hypothetical protein
VKVCSSCCFREKITATECGAMVKVVKVGDSWHFRKKIPATSHDGMFVTSMDSTRLLLKKLELNRGSL